MTITVPFKQVDVFTSKHFKGNPVAVVNFLDVEEDSIAHATLQSIANWTNLSETTFLFKATDPSCDYKLRIFTPMCELPFAGHPTVGSCQAYLEFSGRGAVRNLYQQCGVGTVELIIDGKTIFFKGPKAKAADISSTEIRNYEGCLSAGFSQKPMLLDVGPKWVVGLMQDAKSCYDLEPDFSKLKALTTKYGATGLIVAGKYSGEDKYEMRAFAPGEGVAEDPVCGSGSLALAMYLQELNSYGASYEFEISQGGRVHRDGKVSANIEHRDGEVEYFIGGEAITLVNGEISV
ncbi:LAQU0S11e02058g1_1 [Lachancea quebecensis]|uniref:LAQU0S11e02058g1_1 n=1 Tax=Lachancea quebecensis TaxID=1654605 RepID=A0A0P1KUV5_9SACH|nr:LAQU0S11e02058g1_1 [Lachancea quebecensis]